MAGYHEFSMSNNAVAAYQAGKLPASKAAKAFGFRSTKALRACVHPCEWHHTSKEYNTTDFFDVEQAIRDSDWQELSTWKPHMTKSGWQSLTVEIRQAIQEQMNPPSWNRCRNKGRFSRLMELAAKYPTPYQRHNGLPAVEAGMNGKELTDANYLTVKAEVDARRKAKRVRQS